MEIQRGTSANSFHALGSSRWPISYIVFGLSIPIVLLVLDQALVRSPSITYRPWLRASLGVALLALSASSMILYPIHVFRKRGLGPLLVPMSILGLLKEFLKSLLIFLVVVVVTGLAFYFLSTIIKTETDMPDRWQWATYGYNSILSIILFLFGFTIAPIAEEMFFRGFLYTALKSRMHIVIATLLQALIFALVHRYVPLRTFIVFLFGIAFVVIYEKRKNLWAPIFIHAMGNAVWCIPLLVLTLQNFHVPAGNWDEARVQPAWLESTPPNYIERQEEGDQQRQYAIDTWGSQGSRRWKLEANAFNAVIVWFPEDKTACAKTKLGMVTIYLYYLRDYRRAVIEADNLLAQYPEQREQCGSALAMKGWSYYRLRDFEKSREAFARVLSEFPDQKEEVRSASDGIMNLDFVIGHNR